MNELPATPAATLTRARAIARGEGLQYVYTGNVHDNEGGTTYCPGCAGALVVRDWHRILAYRISAEGRCSNCGAQVAGRYGQFDQPFGARRIPVSISA